MKALKESAGGVILCLFELVVGVLLMINPVGFTSAIIMAAGIVLVISGLAGVIKYFRTEARQAAAGQSMARGLASMLTGGFCALKSHWFIATFPVLTMLYGVIILFNGLYKVQQAVDMLRLKQKNWIWEAVNAAVSIICGGIVLKAPFASAAALWVFTGITLIAEAAFDIATMIAGRKDKAAERRAN